MQINKNYWGSSIRALLTLLVLFSFLGCGFDSRFQQAYDLKELKEEGQIQEGKLESKHREPAIVLLHGLSDKGGLKTLEQKLKMDFPTIPVIALDRDNSETAGIEEQARTIFAELNRNKELADKELILLGDSQGGLVAFSLYDQFHDQLHIKGLITNHAPWEGTHIANTTDQDIDRLMQNQMLQGLNGMLGFMQMMASNQPADPNFLKNLLKQPLNSYRNTKGVEDLKPNSLFLQKVKAKLPNIQIPILAIAGHNIEIKTALVQLFGLPTEFMSFINTMDFGSVETDWANFIGSDHSVNHDFLITLSSQLARNTPKGAKFSEVLIQGYHHYTPLTDQSAYTEITKGIQPYLATE
jgi:pimeloyl-ACP methyl ester carboxylesterase